MAGLVYTVITNGRDDPKPIIKEEGWKYVMFTDRTKNFKPWEKYAVQADRKACRYIKLNPHKFFPQEDITLWVDGCVELKYPPSHYEQYLGDNDIAVLKSPLRNCAYDEAEVCKVAQLDKPEILDAQVERYRLEGFPAFYGMVGTSIMIRRNTDKMKRFNEYWWGEIWENSVRDQVSFPYVAWKTKTKWSTIPDDTIIRHPHKKFV